MEFRTLLALSGAVTMLAACSSADEPAAEEAAATPTPQLTSTPTPVVADDGSPLTPGAWSINESASGASASFGLPGENAQVVITCNRADSTMAMVVAGSGEGMQSYILEAGGTAARLDMMPDGDLDLPSMSAEIARDAPVFGGFVMPGGVIEITSPRGAVLRLPGSSGIRRVFEACA